MATRGLLSSIAASMAFSIKLQSILFRSQGGIVNLERSHLTATANSIPWNSAVSRLVLIRVVIEDN